MRVIKLKKVKRINGLHYAPDGRLLVVGGYEAGAVDAAVWVDPTAGAAAAKASASCTPSWMIPSQYVPWRRTAAPSGSSASRIPTGRYCLATVSRISADCGGFPFENARSSRSVRVAVPRNGMQMQVRPLVTSL